MSNKQASFVEQCLDGAVDPTQIDDFVDQWHEGEDEQFVRGHRVIIYAEKA